MPVYEIDVRGAKYEIDAPDDAAAESAAKNLARQPQHFEFDPANVPQGQTGPQDNDLLAGLSGAVEGIPVVGPYLQSGVENLSAGIGSLLTGEDRQKVRSEMGGMVDKAQADNPITAQVAGTLGAIAGTAPMVMAAPGLFGAGAGPLGAGILGRSAMGAASGAVLGGADAGVRSGGDMGDIALGAGLGGVLGGAGPAIGELAGMGARAIGSRMGRSPSAAQNLFSQAAGADAIDDVGRGLSQMGPDALPMDLGPNLRATAGALGSTPGRNQQIIRSAVGDRQAAAGTRIAGALDDALGQSVDTLAVADDIIARRGAAAKPLYDAAYSKPVPFTKELESLLKRPSVGRALSKARGLAADEGIPSQQWFANIADDGKVTIKNVPDVRQLDLTKRALDDMISAAQRAGNNNEARILTQQKNLLVKMVDDAVPEYAAARQAFSGPTAVLDAMEEGRNAFKNSVTPSQLRKQLAGMGQAEREAYIQGARSQVADIMGTARNDANSARTAFQKGYNKEKLELLIGKDQAKRLMDTLDAETAFFNTNKEINHQSVTAGRKEAMKGTRVATEPGILRSADISKPGEILGRIGDRLSGSSREAVQESVNTELAQLLTSRDPQSLTRIIKIAQAAQRRGDISAQRAREIIQSAMSGGAVRRPLEMAVTPNR